MLRPCLSPTCQVPFSSRLSKLNAGPGMQAPRARAVSIQYYYTRPTSSLLHPNTHRNSLPNLIPLSTLAPRSFLRPPRSLCAVSPSAPSRLDRRSNRARSPSPGDLPPADSSVRLDPGSSVLVPTERKNRHTTLLSGHIRAEVYRDNPLARTNDSIALLAPLGTEHRTANLAPNRPSVCIPEHPRLH